LEINNRFRNICLISLVWLSPVFGQLHQISLKDIFLYEIYDPVAIENICWLKGEEAFLFAYDDTIQNDIYRYDIQRQQQDLFYTVGEFEFDGAQLEIESFQINSIGTYLLIRSAAKRIWRHSRNGTYFLVNLSDRNIIPLSLSNTSLRNAKFSPDGRSVAYVRNNDLYCFNIDKAWERRLTKDGSDDIINGQFGWVYEEEFESADGYRWSPDSKFIAFWREDQTKVKRFTLFNEMLTYPTTRSFGYPKVGETNPTVKIGVVRIKNRRTRWMETDPGYETYIPRIKWTEQPGQLAIMRLNRSQNKLEVLIADTKSGRCRVILTDTDSCWVAVTDDWRFLKDDSFLWTSECSGFKHIYHYSQSGELIRQLTDGKWEITEIIGLDEITGQLYFTGKRDSPLEQQLYTVSLSAGELIPLTAIPGYHKINISDESHYFLDYYSSTTIPEAVQIVDISGNRIASLIDSQDSCWADLTLTYPEFITVTTSDNGTVLNGKITLPWDFNPNNKYPVVIFGYGGPGSQVVTDRWGGRNYLWHQYLCQQGYICFSIDNRGTGGRGKAFKNLTYGDLGNWLVHDQIEGVKYLRSLPYVDADRIGIWGWSGGGYMTAMCLTEGSEYFQVGVAVAPVTDFRLYDTIWTERYMGLLAENAAGYENASVFKYTDRFKGKLLLIHGTGDDNVHPQNSLRLADAFVRKGKFLDQYYYANKNHSIRGKQTTYNVYKRIADYFINNL